MKTKARASSEPGDDRGDVPTGQRMTLRDVLQLNWGSSPAALEGGGGVVSAGGSWARWDCVGWVCGVGLGALLHLSCDRGSVPQAWGLANLIDWINTSIKITWSSEGHVPSPPLLRGTSMQELHEIVCELRMKRAVYAQHLRGPGEILSSGRKDRISEPALGGMVQDLTICPAPVANWPIVTVAAVVADLSGIEGIHQRERDGLEKGKTKDPANDKLGGKGPIEVSRKQLSSGTPRENLDDPIQSR